MRIDLPYGRRMKSLLIPGDIDARFVVQRDVTGPGEPIDAVEQACNDPVEAEPLRNRVRPDTKILLLVADLTRGGGTDTVLPEVIRYLISVGADPANVRLLIARGTHRKLTKEERRFFRAEWMHGVAVEEHDCDDAAQHSALLLTTRGTPVRLNRRVKESDLVILLAPLSFHYFAGFGGGRKLVMPGAADRTSILANHRLSLQDTQPVSLHPACRAGNLEGNPVHEDMCEVIDALDGLFAINFFCDEGGRLLYMNTGAPLASHAKAAEIYSEVHRVPMTRSIDLAVLSCGGYPYDINFLQAHKSLRMTAGALSPGATVLFHAECPEGVGSKSLARAMDMEPDVYLKNAYNDYDLNNQTAVSLLGLTRSYRIGMVSELDEEVLTRAGIEPVSNPEAFLADALDKRDGQRVAVVPYGSRTLPFVNKGSPK